MEFVAFVVSVLAALGTALLAGTFFAFSAFLVRALGGLSAERGIVTMQAIAIAIKKPPFLAVYFGTAGLSALLAVEALLRWSTPGAGYRLTGAVLYLLGPFAVTMLRNVPLNMQLLEATPGTTRGQDQWNQFRSSWSFWNHIRTVTAVLACLCFILAAAQSGNPFAAR